MIVLGTYVFRVDPNDREARTWPIYMEPGYLQCVPAVPDYWRADLDRELNPRLLPVIPLQVHWENDGYPGLVFIDDLRFGEDDPIMVWLYDSWYGDNGETAERIQEDKL